MRANILIQFEDGTQVVYEPRSPVRIVNRGPKAAPYKDFEKVSSHPSRCVGFGSFEGRILTAGHVVDALRPAACGLRTVVSVERDVDAPPDDQTVVGPAPDADLRRLVRDRGASRGAQAAGR
ncbi:hypothetical protein GCM10011404_34420 [Sphingomonas prati]|uniref:Uncharacterized protein n=2 Tax=Sphingomonas prati TaxID=1843237 RepID=A0A7W9BW53_9SPHN|nr:hypothetical protein [Sphingomonas prati]MBB5730989.1 hypothetical protein [Sphingomonas prati]GGE98385.1 hypothetical protein GCM10011404_34420 [Sphingomonas prati]